MVTRTSGYLPSHAACFCSSALSSSRMLYWLKSKWTVSPTLTRKSCALPGRMDEVTGAGGAAIGADGGGAVLTAACLVVQAAKAITAMRHIIFLFTGLVGIII